MWMWGCTYTYVGFHIQKVNVVDDVDVEFHICICWVEHMNMLG